MCHAPSLTHPVVSLPLAAICTSRACLFPWCLEEESQLVGEGAFHDSVSDEPCLVLPPGRTPDQTDRACRAGADTELICSEG